MELKKDYQKSIVKMARFYSTIVLMIICNIIANASIIKGFILNDDPDIIYTVHVNSVDSTNRNVAVFSGIDRNINVSIKDISGNIKVVLKCLGYADWEKEITDINSSSILNLGNIQLEPKSHMLDEVVVRAPKLSVEHDGADYTIRSLSGTIMGNSANGIDMLRWTPGVIVDNNDVISVIGKGSSEIYINDKKVMNNSELRALSPSNVSKIEIIREPDAKYSSQTESVIKIYTKKPIKDYLAASLLDAVDIKQRVSNTTNFTVDGKNGNLSGNVSLSYTLGNTEGYNDSHTIITKENGIYEKFDTTNYSARVHNWNLFAGVNYALNRKSVLGLQYNGVFSRTDMNNDNILNIFDNGMNYLYNNPASMDYNNDRHSVSASYQWTRNKTSNLLIVADYATTVHNDYKDIEEINLHTGNSINNAIKNINDYDIYTLSADYNFTSGKLKSNIGANAGYVNNSGDVIMNNDIQNSERDNGYASFYYTFFRKWNKFTLKGGLRYEYDYTDVKIFDNREQTDDFSKSYSNLLPNISFGYKFNKNVNLTLYYRRTIARPTYSQLRPTIYYINENEYSTGNPLLKPSFTDRINLSANLFRVNLELAYRNITDKITTVYLNEGNNIVEKPINIDRSQIWSISADYFYQNNWFNMGLHADAKIPNISYPYLNETIKVNDLRWSVYANLEFTIANKYMLGTKFGYNSKSNEGYYVMAPTATIDLSAMTILCKGKLLVGVTANDLLRRSMAKWSENRYHNTYIYNHNINDTRGVTIMARYTFNMINNPFKKRSNNDNILNRTDEEH